MKMIYTAGYYDRIYYKKHVLGFNFQEHFSLARALFLGTPISIAMGFFQELICLALLLIPDILNSGLISRNSFFQLGINSSKSHLSSPWVNSGNFHPSSLGVNSHLSSPRVNSRNFHLSSPGVYSRNSHRSNP